jgi:hypothetical protein
MRPRVRFIFANAREIETIEREGIEGSARMTVRSRVVLLWAAVAQSWLLATCGDSDKSAPTARDGSVEAGADEDAGPSHAPPSDPCASAGYHFDGKSDCDVMRCPELSCPCAAPLFETVTLHACLPGQGCVDHIDCQRACDATTRLNRLACQERLMSAGALCREDADCVTGHCRQESSGKLCVDMLGCAQDGHCSAGFVCRFPPSSTDAGAPTSLGNCADGSLDSVCYDDDQCKYHHCVSQRCSGGRENDPCESNSHCASGLCQIWPGSSSGACVSGARGSSCSDDADCSTGLHCTSHVCYSAAVGQSCDEASDCASGLCVLSLCRGGEPGSVCQDDSHCKAGVCAGGLCASGALYSPCYEASDCTGELRCAGQICSDGAAGSPCSTAADCSVRACVRGACSDGENGDTCDAPDECQSNICADPAGADPGRCTSGEKGAPCIYASHCKSMSCGISGTCN